MSAAPPAGTHYDSAYSWTRLAISVLIATIGNVGMWSVVVVLPAVQAEFGAGRGEASLPYTTTMVGFAVGNLLIGRYVDRYGMALPLSIAGAANGVGFVLAGVSGSLWLFALAQGLLIGIGTAANFGPLLADISHWFQRRRGFAVAAAASGNYLAGAVWPPLMQPFLDGYGWRTTYVGIGLFILVTVVPLALFLRRPRPESESAGAGAAMLKPMSLSPRALQALLILAGLGCCVAMSMPQVHIVAYCADLGYGAARGAEMLALMLAGGIVSRLLSGYVADRIGGVPTLLIGSIAQGLSLLFYIPFDGLASLYAVSLLFGLSQGGIVPCYAIIVREYFPAREAGQRTGLIIMATIVGMAFGGWVSGWIYDATGSYYAAFLNGIAWNLLNVVTMLFVLLRTGKPKAGMAAA